MSWAEIKKSINSDLSTPLNELPRGIFVNPVYIKDYTSSNRTYPYLKTYRSAKTISSSYIEKDSRSIQRYNELWSFASYTKVLRKVDLLTGTGTNVLTTNNNITGLILVTKTYVYFWEGDYISRYNKDTGEYKTSTDTLTVTKGYVGYICYEDDIYAYCLDNNTLNGKGYYKVTDNVDNGGVFTFTKVSTNLPLYTENTATKFNGCVKSIIELPNNQILIGWYMYYSSYLYLLKINVTNGSSTSIVSYDMGATSNYAYKFTLCPVKDDFGKIVGVIFGLNKNKLYLYGVDGTSTSELSSNLYTYNTTSSTSEYSVSYYDNGIFYTLDTNSGEYRVDSSLAERHSLPIVFLPKGTKMYQNTSSIKMVFEKLRDNISINSSGLLVYSRKTITPDENGVFTCQENGLYEVPSDVDNDNGHYLLGTFF